MKPLTEQEMIDLSAPTRLTLTRHTVVSAMTLVPGLRGGFLRHGAAWARWRITSCADIARDAQGRSLGFGPAPSFRTTDFSPNEEKALSQS